MKHWFKKILKWLLLLSLALSALLLGLGITFWIMLQNPSFQSRLAKEIEKNAPAPFNHHLKIGRIGGRLPGYLFIDRVEATLPSGDELSLKNLSLGWNWKALWGKRFLLNSFVVDELKLKLIQDEDGAWLKDLTSSSNLTPSPPPEEVIVEDGPLLLPELSIDIRRFAVKSFQFSAISAKEKWNNLSFTIPDLVLMGKVSLTEKTVTGFIDYDQHIQLKIDQHPRLKGHLKAKVRLLEDRWDAKISPLRLNTPSSVVDVEVQLDHDRSFYETLSAPQSFLQHSRARLEMQSFRVDGQEIEPLLEDNSININDIRATGLAYFTPEKVEADIQIQTGLNRISFKTKAELNEDISNIANHTTQLDAIVVLGDWVPEGTGTVALNTKMEGSLDAIQLELNSQMDRIGFPKVIAGNIALQLSSQIPIKYLVDHALPTLPSFEFSDNLQLTLEGMESWWDQHHSAMEWPSLDLAVSELNDAPPFRHVKVKLEKGDREGLILIDALDEDRSKLLSTELALRHEERRSQLSFRRLHVDSRPWVQGIPALSEPLRFDAPALVHWHWADQSLEISSFQLNSASPLLKLDASVPLEGEMLVTLALLERPTIDYLSQPLLGADPLEGTTALNFNIRGSLQDPKVNLNFETLSTVISMPSDNLKLDIPEVRLRANVSRALGAVKTDGLIKVKGEPPIQFNLQYPLSYTADSPIPSAGNVVDFHFFVGEDKKFTLNVLKPIAQPYLKHLEGMFALDLRGKLDIQDPLRPWFEGYFNFQDGRVALIDPPLDVEDIAIDLDLSPNKVELQQLKARQGEGVLNMNGFVYPSANMNWLNPTWETNLSAKAWPLLAPPNLTRGQMEASLQLSGNLERHNIAGEVHLSDLMIRPTQGPVAPSALDARDPHLVIVEQIETWEVYDQDQKEANDQGFDFLKSANILLKVKLHQNNWVRHDSFRGELTGELEVKNRYGSDEIHPMGPLKLQKAELDFQGNKFMMDHGFLNFQGDLIPSIDMVFTTKVKEWEIDVILRAPFATEVTPELRSRPWLSNSDIISVLLFGKPIHSQSDGESQDGNLAQDLAASQGASLISQKLGLSDKGIDLEDVSASGGKIRFGRYLHPKIYVSAAKTVGEQEGHELSIEYLLRKNLKVKLSREDQDPLGVDTEWTLDY